MFRKVSIAILTSLMAFVFGAAGLKAEEGSPSENIPNPWPAKTVMDLIMGDYEGTFTPAGQSAGKAHGRIVERNGLKYEPKTD